MGDEVAQVRAHVVVADLATPALDPADHHHLARVLRLRPGEAVSLTDGKGGLRVGRWEPSGAVGELGPVQLSRPKTPAITVGITPVKGDRPEWAVQKLTELGVDRILILRTARSVVRWDDSRVAKLRRVAREACAQSRRCFLPSIEAVEGLPPGAALAHPGGERLTLRHPSVLIGPEGGWTEDELAERDLVSLGDGILRAETAALAAAVLLTAARS